MAALKSKQEKVHSLSPDEEQYHPPKRSKLYHSGLLPVRHIDEAAKNELHNIIQDANSLHQFLGLAKVYCGIAMD